MTETDTQAEQQYKQKRRTRQTGQKNKRLTRQAERQTLRKSFFNKLETRKNKIKNIV